MGELLPRARLVVERCPAAGASVVLSREEAAHARARRLVAGDAVTIVDGTGIEARGRLLELTRSGGAVLVERVSRSEENRYPIQLLLAGARAERLAWAVEKATELEVERVVLISTERTQSFRASATLAARLSRVAREAAKQAELARWPAVEGPLALSAALATAGLASKVFLDLGGEPFPQRLAAPAALLVGPEGGWSASERKAAEEAGWSRVALPSGKLRAETAVVAGLVLARAALALA